MAMTAYGASKPLRSIGPIVSLRTIASDESGAGSCPQAVIKGSFLAGAAGPVAGAFWFPSRLGLALSDRVLREDLLDPF
jgi:hypothetical protein